MSVAVDLLEQARWLARKEIRKPKQASLRRSISTTYYALFHFLGEESARKILGSGGRNRQLRDLARTGVAHTRLREVTAEFTKSTPRPVLRALWNGGTGDDPMGIDRDLDFRIIARSLGILQQLRHAADYDFSQIFSRQQSLDASDMADEAMQAWERLRVGKPEAFKLFAMAILMWPGLSARG